ncbi:MULTISPECIES: OmpH family outer membrane protein [Bacteroidaceae]|jgi:outer membrane protein|uniref:OmpH family outer membrane protein n=1 Tax=Bacteroidaceae TaxID=815 RepID=UPI000335C1FE|nr:MULTISPECIES: OmpH family outer membrane protein [Bacteroidaceae]MCL1607431.1 OmpH family outer membrane protein [Mediterranea sp. ET5]MDM8122318.1 OmpH family outer membrane protein [Mediterranea massiliensis]MDM8198757.1 OmpH family outer membrane protein [Mediterranea massiliensis]CDD82013.1 uncharacterized protein BN666_01430 [Bacteroides sp. CAG:462]
MKKRNFIVSGLSALAIMVAFTQCDGNKAANTTSDNSTPAGSVSDLKIAYVEIDSLLNNYNLCKDLNEAMIKKQENVEVTLKEKMKSLDNEMRDFERKYQNHVFTPERAQQEQNRLIKKRQDLEALHQRLMGELQQESDKNNIQLRDSINAYLKEYNKTKGYNLIINNAGFNNLLYADPALNITQEVIDGLNKRYTPAKAE